ncbi:MAG TPA: glutathione S-transferase family protein [Pseudomonadales bacterium]
MKLYGSHTSPFVRHCRIALLEAGIHCEFIEADAAVSARLSPMQKLPFLQYQEHGEEKMLTDSSAILRLIRERANQPFMPDVAALNAFCAANTLMDAAINLFYLEKDGITPEQSSYLRRQQSRLQTGLADLATLPLRDAAPWSDTELRIACFLDWALFRQRLTLDDHPKLASFLDHIRAYPHFAATAPKA